MDHDETPIGGIRNPMQPTKELFYVTVAMDIIALVLSLYINFAFFLCISLYILASRAYSYRRIRLKKYPILGFLTVFTFQGALIFFATFFTLQTTQEINVPILPCVISSLLIGALYPLTQIYQHEEDKKDGVISISYLLGKRLTFVFSMLLFLAATFLFYLRFHQQDELKYFYWYLAIMLPVVLFFLYWMMQVWKNEEAASFRNSLLMNVLSTLCTTVFFIILIVAKH
jgi:1,4-dihydroxy-2-naphthoate octaprenyltransferase